MTQSERNITGNIDMVSVESLSPLERWDRWDALDATHESAVAGLRTREDERLWNLIKDFSAWEKAQGIEWRAKYNYKDSGTHLDTSNDSYRYVFACQNEQGQSIQLEMFFDAHATYVTIHEYQVDPQQDPKMVVEERETFTRPVTGGQGTYTYLTLGPRTRLGTLKLTCRAFKEGEDIPSYMNRTKSFVGYIQPDEERPSNLFEYKNVYGRAEVDLGLTWGVDPKDGRSYLTHLHRVDVVRRRHEDPAKQVDPIDAGGRIVNLLRGAELLGAFDSGRAFLEPIRVAEVSPQALKR